ncbi:MAG: hypothetical protein JO032_09750 [Alphaproteobacteria bacterium]|nr:hypothetical protein [Alphaproteobacteria bacterium]
MSDFFPSDAELMARTFGVVLGAASCNDDVSNARLDATAAKMKAVLTAAADDPRDAETACERFSAAVVAGRRAAQAGSIEDWAAENALQQIEADLDEAPLMLD